MTPPSASIPEKFNKRFSKEQSMPRNRKNVKKRVAKRPLSAARTKSASRKKAVSRKKSRRTPTSNAIALKDTVSIASRSQSKSDLKYVRWDTVPIEDLNPLLQRHFVVGGDIMVARVLMKKGCIVPLHSHHNEQFTYILKGALKFWIDGKEIVVHAGEVLTIPRNMPHRAEALEDTVDLDVFNPPRMDWINKTDEYLRNAK
jgi:quercetin dioxygenase-like cupin family protein